MISKHGSITKEIFFNHGRGKKVCVEKEEENPYNKKNYNCISELPSKYSGFFFY